MDMQKNEMKKQVILFSSMIFFTIISFFAVSIMTVYTAGMFIVTLAIIQVIFQLSYFMHMKDKGHEVALITMFSGVFVSFFIFVGIILLT